MSIVRMLDDNDFSLKKPGYITALLLVLVSLLCTGYQSFAKDHMSIIVFYLLCLFFGMIITYSVNGIDKNDKIYLLKVFITAYSINILFVYIFAAYFTNQTGEPFIPAIGHRHPDDLKFYNTGLALAMQWLETKDTSLVNPLLGYKYIGYPYLLGGIYYFADCLGDLSPITPRIVNSMLGALIVVLAYCIGKLVYGKRVAYQSVILMLLFPIWYYYSSIILRDIVIAFFINLYVYEVLSITNKFRFDIRPLIGVIVSIVVIYFFRTPVLLIIFVATLIYLSVQTSNNTLRILLLLAVFLTFVAMLIKGVIIGGETITDMLNQADRWGSARESLVHTKSLAMRFVYGSPLFLKGPLILIYTLVMPIPPIQGYMLHHYIVGVGALVWYFYIPFWIYAMAKSIKNKKAFFLTITSLLLFIGVAIIQPDIRHKIQFLGMALVQTANGMVLLEKQRLKIFLSVGVVGLVLFGLYIALKI